MASEYTLSGLRQWPDVMRIRAYSIGAPSFSPPDTSMTFSRLMFKTTAIATTALVTLLAGAPAFSKVKIPDGGIKPDDLFIVDCLLQSQVRQLGEGMTFLAPRRPIRTTAHDCAIRGGEYVAYDRANYGTALKVWLPAASKGDKDAQTIVGEIYEQGLGVAPDFAIAKGWYEKAAAQGDSRAMLNLGSLYESGKGVPADPVAAMNWYRKASGLNDGQLELTTDADRSEREKNKVDAERLREEVLTLKGQLDNATQEIDSREAELKRSRTDLAEMKKNAAAPQAQSQVTPDQVRALEMQIKNREAEISKFQRATEQLLGQMTATRGAAPAPRVASITGPIITVISPEVAPTRDGQSMAQVFENVQEYSVIGRIEPVDTILALKVNDQDFTTRLDRNGMFQVPLSIGQGNTAVKIQAVSKDGKKAEQNFVIAREVSAPAARREASRQLMRRMQTDLGKYYALVIGNNDYSAFPALKTAAGDAKAVGDVLRSRYGYEVTSIQNGSRQQMLAALAAFSEQLTAKDNLLIYFAGHGQLEASNGSGYWIPVDGSKDDPKTWISNEAITKFISTMQARHVMVVADSCYAGTLSGTAIREIPATAKDEDVLFISRVKARTVLTSGGLQPVADSGAGGHSVFAGAFLQVLTQNGTLLDGINLERDVEAKINARGNTLSQRPEYTALKHAGHEGSEFFFLPRDAS